MNWFNHNKSENYDDYKERFVIDGNSPIQYFFENEEESIPIRKVGSKDGKILYVSEITNEILKIVKREEG